MIEDIDIKKNIILKKTDELIAYHNNNKKHPEEQVNMIALSISKYGFNNPVIIDNKNIVVSGHGRLLAAKQLNMSTIPWIMLENLTEDEIKAFRIMDNKSAISDWDYEAIANEIEYLQSQGVDTEYTGFSHDEIDAIVDQYAGTNPTQEERIQETLSPQIAEEIQTEIQYGDIIEIDPRYCQIIIQRMRILNPDIKIQCINRNINLEC